ncbi:undecaprenyl-phosphate alpha-N-acetylglucosaminephosphotransferase [Liquorilactobacillus ghanensis DSM 18630]|jgi:UDP-GlcNAc:undecaprenyl-phosphate GlcNAc-1-phosphate transferase|uniref:Undecaprenyl-phosphate alpha-N-acetylglucosaminephosphotransferase n=2 Tax=Liquorilactobacillus ghanensis TaxID=399370 RepID=A0A0R1VT71_9LACO|nr:undecaprenyl-phosphate alpha-N-acetylglucosaminephosphotransferase [Liquorilactobacillus ghanensis DSM 18630]
MIIKERGRRMSIIIASLLAAGVLAFILTPLVRNLAFKLGAVDKPNARRVNKVPMPTMGGLAIFVAFNLVNFFIMRQQYPPQQLWTLFAAELTIIITGIIDDIYELTPKQKLCGITLAALIVYFFSGIRMTTLTLPFLGTINLGWFSLPVTLIWILAITNAVNLIDGLDGLAVGVAIIALITSGITSYLFLNVTGTYVAIMMFTLVGSLLGFLPYNFHPAKIYLGDTGALFIGFMISVFSLYGLKNATFITIVIPVIILGVPITDTVYAILRRVLNKKPISQADKHHLHHRLMEIGLSHTQTVLVIYGISLIFSCIALLYPFSNLLGSILLTIATLFGLELFVESIGLVGTQRRPLINWIGRLFKIKNKKDK